MKYLIYYSGFLSICKHFKTGMKYEYKRMKRQQICMICVKSYFGKKKIRKIFHTVLVLFNVPNLVFIIVLTEPNIPYCI